MKKLVALFSLLGSLAVSGWAQAADVKGVWLIETKDAQIELFDCDSKICGKVVWLKEPNNPDGSPRLDKDNPDAALRSRPLMGHQNVWGMTEVAPGEWEDGSVYDAESGNTYKGEMKLVDADHLKLRGCIGFCSALTSRSQTWTRVK